MLSSIIHLVLYNQSHLCCNIAIDKQQGNFDIPKKFSTKLNTFVTNLRKAMRRKKEGLLQKELTDDRIDRLNAINFTWEMKNPGRQKETGDNVSFDHLYDLLVEFKDQYGHTQVAKQSKIWRSGGEKGPTRPEYKRLPFFLASVRSEHEIFLQGKPCALDAEKVRKLTELGVQWKKPGEFTCILEVRLSCLVCTYSISYFPDFHAQSTYCSFRSSREEEEK